MKEPVIFRAMNLLFCILLCLALLILSPLFFALSNASGVLYFIGLVIFVVLFFFRNYVFYSDRLEVIRYNFVSRKEIIMYTEILKVQYHAARISGSVPEIIVYTKEKPKEGGYAFMAPRKSVAKRLFADLHQRGVRIEFDCDQKQTNSLKSW